MSDTPVPPPPLGRWGKTWRTLLAVGGGAAVWGSIAQYQWQQARALFWIDLVLGISSVVAMQFRRRWPLQIALFTTATQALSASATFAGAISYVSMATRRKWDEIIPVVVVAIAAGQVYAYVEPAQDDNPWWLSLLISVVFGVILTAIGMYIGARRELLWTLRDRAERAEREQALRVAQAQAQERTRIAREMHDVLAHRMSLVAMHAGALTYRDDLSADETRETAEIIQMNSHRALTDLREILGVLRDSDTEEAPNRPQPTLCDLDELVADERAAGARITLDNRLPPSPELPQVVGRTAFRIVQEGLTNARKHAPDTQVSVSVTGAPNVGLSVEVRNPMRVGVIERADATPGFGLIGLSERAALAHGRSNTAAPPRVTSSCVRGYRGRDDRP